MKKLMAGIALIVSIALLGTPAWAGKHAQRRGTAAEAQAMVKRAIAFFDKVGARMAFNHFTYNPAPEFKKADLYIFVFTMVEGGPLVAHGASPSLVGRDVVKMIDAEGLNIGKALLEKVTTEGTWVDYKWRDPLTGKLLQKSSWVVRHKGYVFGCGIYKP